MQKRKPLKKQAGLVTNEAEKRKMLKYSSLTPNYHFVPVTVETTMGVFGSEARVFIGDLGRRLKAISLDPLAHHQLVQRISVAIQRGNAAAVLGSLPQGSIQ